MRPAIGQPGGKSNSNHHHATRRGKLLEGECPYTHKIWKRKIEGSVEFPPVDAIFFRGAERYHTKCVRLSGEYPMPREAVEGINAAVSDWPPARSTTVSSMSTEAADTGGSSGSNDPQPKT